jgi:molybdopterin-guanine dinucleotide biosynthesis protein A
MKTNGFVLAGGKSARMGRDKALLDWHGRTLLDHMKDLLAGAVDQVRVVGREEMPDRTPGCGPLGGILTLLEATETDTNLVVAVDLPFLTDSFLKYFRTRLESSSHAVVACNIDSRFPLCLGIRRGTAPIVRQRLEASDRSVHGFIAACDAEVLDEAELECAGFTRALFQNLNTLEDYASLKRPPKG